MQPPSLLSLALQRLINFVDSLCHQTHQNEENVVSALRNYLTIPPNIFDRWADGLLIALNGSRRQLRSCAQQQLVFSHALSRLNLDHFPLLQGNVAELCHLLPRCSRSLKHLSSSYAPFFWNQADILLLEQSAGHLKNLQTLSLCNLDLNENPTFLQTVGTHCPKIKELDLSHGRIPASQCKAIVDNFPQLEILKMRQKSEKYRAVTTQEALRMLSQLLKLKILDDDTIGTWSCLLPALKQLDSESVAAIQYLPIYQTMDVDAKLLHSVVKIKLYSRAFKGLDTAPVAEWLKQSFPALVSIDLHLDNIFWSPAIESFLQCRSIGHKIHSLHLSGTTLSYGQFVTIGRCAPNLRRLDVINSSPLDVDSGTLQFNDDWRFFKEMEFLSYTGAWDESVASLLLDHCVRLKELQLKTHSLPLQFLKQNPLAELQRLVLDLSYMPLVDDMELDFVRRVVERATCLAEIRFNSRPTKEWEDLRQHLKATANNFDLQILCTI